MGKLTKEKLEGLAKESIVVLYALNLAYPKPVNEKEIIKIINDCNLMCMSKEKLINCLVRN